MAPVLLCGHIDLLTTKEVAERLGVTMKRVQAMIRDERLPAEKRGRDYFIREEDLKLVEDRKPGRPSKSRDSAVLRPDPREDPAPRSPSRRMQKEPAKNIGRSRK